MWNRGEVDHGLLRSCTVLNFDVFLGRAAFSNSFMLEVCYWLWKGCIRGM